MMPSSLDTRIVIHCPLQHVNLVVARVSDTARTLERNHLCGPMAGLIQGEMVAAISLLGRQLAQPSQILSLRIALPEGLLKGAVLEITGAGTIRGYTQQKVIPELDEVVFDDSVLFDKAMGKIARTAIIVTEGASQLSQTSFNTVMDDRLTTTDIIEDYFISSLQRRALVQISAGSKDGYLEFSRAILCEFEPEANNEDFQRISDLFNSGAVQTALDHDVPILTIAQSLGLTPDASTLQCTPISFACSCSSDRVYKMLASLPTDDLKAMIAKDTNTDIFCHMCGKCFSITPAQLETILQQRNL